MEPSSQADRTGATTPSEHGYREHLVPRGGQRIYAREHPGVEPTLVLLHGFPDDLHLYDRLLPHLNPPRRVVTFDFWAGAPPTSRLATPTPPPTRPATSTRSSSTSS
jgi:pimeloyl-ACP methyl ester carboxylesterase